ncbi:spore coat U domain-containing protein [Klebsiella oxytoca]|uniref:Fimbrial major subunit CsuA/B family protein n=1 Tax=Klebsiella oxytoca TaxID=571 RepID=A0A6B8MZK5_KLEOX|nr:spore coat protein U domain-containing protein [Klebsiella oxytoca]QGN38668.1 fimbrial major subunit CsuA/B family protein [Klebsiella oxytoca]
MKNILLLFAALFLLAHSASSLADCSIKASSPNFGSVDSFTLNTVAQGVNAGAGFTCTKPLISVAATNTVTANIISASNANGNSLRLLGDNGVYIPYNICKDSSCGILYGVNSSIPWSSTSLLDLLGLFNSTDGTLPLYFRIPPGSNVPAGTYTDQVSIRWDYHLCYAGVANICIWVDSNPNSPLISTVNVTLKVTNSCYIDSAPDVAFTPAAIPANFNDLNGKFSIRCTQNAAYTVNLASDNASNGNWRQLISTINSQNYFLQYQFFQSNGSAWTQANNLSLSGTGASQDVNYTLKINTAQPNQPAGSYSDNVKVTVTY